MNLLETIGATPLITLPSFAAELPGLTLLAKAEFMNPSGSVKDRAAKAMVLDGIARGLLTPGKTIIDATSGNTGIAYAMIGAALGYHVRLYLPQNTSPERKRIIRHYGATIVRPIRWKVLTAPILKFRHKLLRIRNVIFIRTNITTPSTRIRISRRPEKRSGSRAGNRSPILSPVWAPPAASSASRGGLNMKIRA